MSSAGPQEDLVTKDYHTQVGGLAVDAPAPVENPEEDLVAGEFHTHVGGLAVDAPAPVENPEEDLVTDDYHGLVGGLAVDAPAPRRRPVRLPSSTASSDEDLVAEDYHTQVGTLAVDAPAPVENPEEDLMTDDYRTQVGDVAVDAPAPVRNPPPRAALRPPAPVPAEKDPDEDLVAAEYDAYADKVAVDAPSPVRNVPPAPVLFDEEGPDEEGPDEPVEEDPAEENPDEDLLADEFLAYVDEVAVDADEPVVNEDGLDLREDLVPHYVEEGEEVLPEVPLFLLPEEEEEEEPLPADHAVIEVAEVRPGVVPARHVPAATPGTSHFSGGPPVTAEAAPPEECGEEAHPHYVDPAAAQLAEAHAVWHYESASERASDYRHDEGISLQHDWPIFIFGTMFVVIGIAIMISACEGGGAGG